MKKEEKGVNRLPDKAVCRAKDINLPSFAACLLKNSYQCHYATPYGNEIYCSHPNREEIIKKTKDFFKN